MLQLYGNFYESKRNPFWIIILENSSGTNYTPNEHEYFDQYGQHVTPTEIMPRYRYLASLLDQNEISF